MNLIRYRDPQGRVQHGAWTAKGEAVKVNGDVYCDYVVTDQPAQVETLLVPLVPRAILGVGLNYRRHAEEAGAFIQDHPVIFYKGVNTVQDPEAPILLPAFLRSEKVDYECELAVVIGQSCKNVSRKDALDYVLGYTCANDVSARDWQLDKGGGQWCRGKSFDTFSPLGPCLTTAESIADPNDLQIQTTLNGEVAQGWNTDDMIFGVPAIVSFLSASTTLLPGTVIMTGTPHGVGMAASPPRWLRPDDVVTVEIERIGALINPVEEESVHSTIDALRSYESV